jgi:hypothetical protein
MDRFFLSLPIKLCIVILLSAVSSARADEALPSQDQALARALENHPDIVAAKAKVALAEAELYGKRMEVSRQVLGLYGSLNKLGAQVDVAKAVLHQSKLSAEKGGALAVEVQTAEAELVQAINQREQMDKELRLLIGTASPAAGAVSSDKKPVVKRQAPQGAIVEKIEVALDKPVKLEFVDIPLEEVMAYLTSVTGIKFSLQEWVLEESGLGSDEPISLHTNEVPLHAAMQAFEDAYPGMQFIVRDYGVLVTTEEHAEEHGYVPVLERSEE